MPDIYHHAPKYTSLCSLKQDDGRLFLQIFLTGNEQTVDACMKTFFTLISLPEDDRSKVRAAIRKIRLEGVGYKRRRTEEKCPSASSLGNLKHWGKNQGALGMCCHLPPAPKLHGMHVSLRVKAFGNFLDRMEEQPSGQFTSLAMKLILVCSEVYASEADILAKVKPILRELFAGLDVDVDRMHSEESDARNAVVSDCTVIFSSNGVKIAIVSFELKEDISGTTANPDIQNIGHVMKFNKRFQGHAAPMLLVSLAGFSHMQVYGAAWNGDDFCHDPLTHPLSTLFVPSDPLKTCKKVEVMLQAIRGAVVDLKAYYGDVGKLSGPYFMRDRKLHSVRNLKEKERVFEAKLNDQPVVVKFSRCYGEGAHSLLAEKQLAPKIVSVETLPGGWIAIVMEKVLGVALSSRALDDTASSSLKEAVETLHDAGFVHGDLRPQNIMWMTESSKVCILDFDWAGKAGEAFYPCDINMDENCGWHAGVTPGGVIQLEHDRYQLQNILRS